MQTINSTRAYTEATTPVAAQTAADNFNEIIINKEDVTMNVHADNYVTKEMIRKELEAYGITLTNNKFKSTKREELLEMLNTAKQEQTQEIQDVPEEVLPYAPVVYDDAMSMTILEKVIKIADKNYNRNQISHWMLTSAISEVVVGQPLQGKDTEGNWKAFYKEFTQEQRQNIDAIREEFLKRSGFIPVLKDDCTTSAFLIPITSLVYGRCKWLNVGCVYRNKDDKNIAYCVFTYGIKDIKTGEMTLFKDTADKAAKFAEIEATCVFIR